MKILLVLTAAGCARASTGEPAGATTRPVTGEYSLAENRQIDRLIAHGADVDWYLKLPAGTTGQLFFGALTAAGRPEDAIERPILASKARGDWKYLLLPEEFLIDYEWVYAAAGPEPREVWAVLDAREDSLGLEIMLMHSTDGGANWQSMTFNKPNPLAYFADFVMDKAGHGRVTLAVEHPADHAGLYHFRTIDDGKTWTGPTFESDAMKPADAVDDDQPDARPVLFRPRAK